ncbi:MAG: ABC transporter permease [Chloroflexi bacterium]|nr:ABC transporter permease [Chloroflexota bacterium]
MKKNTFWFNIIFAFLGGAILLLIALPLISILLETTPKNLLLAFSDPEVMDAIGLSFLSAAIATIIGILGGVPLAFLLAHKRFPGSGIVEAIVNLPLVVPHTAAGIALLLVFGRKGLLGSWFEPLGIVFTDNISGIVVAMLFVSLPFLINSSRDAFKMVDGSLEKAAMVDGAGVWSTFWFITLPLAWRGVVSGALMMWARGISEFGAVVILSYHPKVASVLVFERFQGFGLDAALPVALLLVLGSVIVFAILRGLIDNSRLDHLKD